MLSSCRSNVPMAFTISKDSGMVGTKALGEDDDGKGCDGLLSVLYKEGGPKKDSPDVRCGCVNSLGLNECVIPFPWPDGSVTGMGVGVTAGSSSHGPGLVLNVGENVSNSDCKAMNCSSMDKRIKSTVFRISIGSIAECFAAGQNWGRKESCEGHPCSIDGVFRIGSQSVGRQQTAPVFDTDADVKSSTSS